jgi:hypothetical protein
MSQATQPIPAAVTPPMGQVPQQTDPELKQAIRGVLSRLSPLVARDRRRYARQPMPMLLELTPVDSETGEPSGSPIIVVGKSLSEAGIGFFHQDSITHRHVVVRLESLPEDDVAFLVDLAWCRYTRYGWYESGGRFLKVIQASTRQPASAGEL